VASNYDSRGLPLVGLWLGHVYEIWRVIMNKSLDYFLAFMAVMLWVALASGLAS